MYTQYIPPLGIFNYTVQPNDSLYNIADRFNTTIDVISRFNYIPNPDMIYIGQSLIIPYSPPESILYKVMPGDTLYAIAERFNANIDNIIRFNYLQDPNLIYPGQILIVPTSLRYT